MTLSLPQFISILLMFVIGYGILSCYDKKNKIFCTFKANDRTEQSRWTKKSQDKIIFKGSDGRERWYDIEIGRTTLKWITNGIHLLFPLFGRCLTYTQDSRRPEDPFTFSNTMDADPAVRATLDAKDDVLEFEQRTEKGLGVGKMKGGLLQQWMPIIMILGFAILGYLIYQQGQHINLLGKGQNLLESMMGQLLQK